MITSAALSAGWKARALEQGFALLRKRRFGEFSQFLRSRFGRALARLAGRRLTLLLPSASSRWFPSTLELDPVADQELSMRLLVRMTASWIGSLDRDPVALDTPPILLQTSLTANDDAAWPRRCPHIEIFEIPSQHRTLFDGKRVDLA